MTNYHLLVPMMIDYVFHPVVRMTMKLNMFGDIKMEIRNVLQTHLAKKQNIL